MTSYQTEPATHSGKPVKRRGPMFADIFLLVAIWLVLLSSGHIRVEVGRVILVGWGRGQLAGWGPLVVVGKELREGPGGGGYGLFLYESLHPRLEGPPSRAVYLPGLGPAPPPPFHDPFQYVSP